MEILTFSKANLAAVLSNKYTSEEQISAKNHFGYFSNYLGKDGLDARTIVVEGEYVSKDFLHDYAWYYALCFEAYPKICKRIHFFSNVFDEKEFKSIILSTEKERELFWEHYLGFIVIKPIPVKVIGFTILKTYSDVQKSSPRVFHGTRDYKVHIYGNQININSLAFQEQDSVLAACATTAIWSMLNKAATDFYTVLKSPGQITKDADNVSPDGGRLFPNKGLNLRQMCQAIFSSGLVSEVKQPDCEVTDNKGKRIPVIPNLYLKKILAAYLPLGIPIILIVNVPNGYSYGLHAITVSGYKQNSANHISPKPQISWRADEIEEFYAHDDQWGPFARISFQNEIELITPWTESDGSRRPTYATNIIVPTYPKVRISYEEIESIVHGLNSMLSCFFDDIVFSDLAWDIKINFSENFKTYLKSSMLNDSDKCAYLTRSMPKYLWIATCFIKQQIAFEFTFDATGVSSGMTGTEVVCYFTKDMRVKFVESLKTNRPVFETLFQHPASINYYEFLIEKLTSSNEPSFNGDLNEV